jgi:hypothetical protein
MAMIYAVSEFTDEKDTDWKVQIVDADSVATDLNYAFNLGPDGFRINYGYDNFDRSKPILGSKLMITLFHPLDNSAAFDALYTALDTTEEGSYRVEVYRDPDGDNEAWWIGTILPEQTVIPDEFPHAAVSITAVDGLANLKGIKYNNDGAAYSGTDLITTHLYKALSKVHASGFWASGDILLRFYEDFISAQYKAWIGVDQNKQLENAKIEHSTFLNTNSDGVHEYYSAFEVLESIALTLNASIFMAKGSFWLVPLGATQSHVQNNLDIWNQITGNGTVTYNTSTNLTDYSVAFGSNSAIYEKLTGWERSSTPAFKEVKRVRNYQGDMPLISRSYYNLDRVSNSLATGATLEDEDAVQPAGRAYKLTGNFQFFTSGISSLTGQDAVLRPRIRFEIKVGDAGGTVNYLDRDDSYDSSAVATAVWYNETFADGYTYRTPQYGTDVWNSTSSNRLTWVGSAFNGNNGGASYPLTQTSQFYHGELFDITLPEIPAEATGLQITATLDFINWAGNAVTAVDFFSPSAVVATWKFTQFSIRVQEDEDVQEFGEVDIVATNEDTARYEFNQDETLIGDKISEGSLGVININDGAPGGAGYSPATYWNNSQDTTSTNLSINGLGVRERLGANKKARRTERGTLYRRGVKFIHPYSVLINTEDTNNFYQLTGLNFIASTGEYDIECIYLLRNITGITVANLDDRPSKGPGETGLPPDGVYQSKGPIDETIQGENTTKLGFITTDTYGITKVTTSTGGAGIDINLPIAKASAGVELISINTAGTMGPVADGASGEFLKTDGAGVLSWDTAGGGGGWFGSTTLLKVMPTDFFMNDDYNRAPVMVEDDNINILGIRAPSTLTELYAFIPIPTGYKATHVHVYTSAAKTNAVDVYEFNQRTGGTSSKGLGDFNTLLNITDITSGTQANIVIKILPASTATVIYGADITIAAV